MNRSERHCQRREKSSLSFFRVSKRASKKEVGALGLVLACQLLATSCQTTPQEQNLIHKEEAEKAVLTEEVLQDMRKKLLDLPSIEGELFNDYLARAKARLLVEKGPEQVLLPNLLEMRHLKKQEHQKELLPLLVGLWVRSRGQKARVSLLKELIGHKTFLAKGQSPGKGTAFDALQKSLRKAALENEMQLHDTENIAFEIGAPWGETTPKIEESVAFLVHADVVPANETGWKTNPFQAELVDGKIFGRGSLDDKGPLVAVFSALNGVLHAGIAKLKKQPILVIGTSEETHWEGIDRFQKVRGTPSVTVVADANFPVGVGEKGVASVRIYAKELDAAAEKTFLESSKNSSVQLLSVEGGQVSNQVPAEAFAIVRIVKKDSASALPEDVFAEMTAKLKKRKEEWPEFSAELNMLKTSTAGESIENLNELSFKISVHGQAAHAADPALGKNAISDLVAFLVRDVQPAASPCVQVLQVLDEKLGRNFAGDKLGLTDVHERFSASTVNLGTVQTAGFGGCKVALNLRWPPPRSAEQVVDVVGKHFLDLGTHIEVTGGGLDPFLQDENTPLVFALQKAYRAVTQKPADVVTVSGTTYAKAVKGAVTFGPEPAGGHHSRMHAPNEYISVEELNDLAEMYAHAMVQLSL